MTAGDFEVAWTSAGRRSLNRLPQKVTTAVIEFVDGSPAANPPRPLRFNLDALHSARRGDYGLPTWFMKGLGVLCRTGWSWSMSARLPSGTGC